MKMRVNRILGGLILGLGLAHPDGAGASETIDFPDMGVLRGQILDSRPYEAARELIAPIEQLPSSAKKDALLKEWETVKAGRTDLLDKAAAIDNENQALHDRSSRLNARASDLQSSVSSMEAEIQEFNRSCGGRQRGSDYDVCVMFKSRLTQKKNNINDSVASHRSAVQGLRNEAASLINRTNELRTKLQDWEETVREFTPKAKAAVQKR